MPNPTDEDRFEELLELIEAVFFWPLVDEDIEAINWAPGRLKGMIR